MNERYDLTRVRSEFPITKHTLYFDSAHQTPLATSVRCALDRFFNEASESAGSKLIWQQRQESVRHLLAQLIGAQPSEIAFTKNTSEGLNIAAHALEWGPGENAVLVEGDHPNNSYAWFHLRKRGLEVRSAPLVTDWVDAETLRPYIDERTRAISLSHVTFHAGQRHDLASLGKLCEERGILLIVDAMQSVGVMPVDVESMGVSILAAGCHKGLLTPHGLGIFYCRRTLTGAQPTYVALASLANPPTDLVARPDSMALHSDARRFELGNFNYAAIHALQAALELIYEIGLQNITEHLLDLGDRLIMHIHDQGIRIVGPRDRERRSHIYVLDLPGDGWLEYFADNHIRVSRVRDGIRISFALFNTGDEVDQLAEIIRQGLRDRSRMRIQTKAE